MGHGRRVKGERGVTLIELMMYLAVMAILGVPLVMVTLSVSRSAAEGDMLSKILERNRSCLQRMTSEYRESLKGTTVVPAGGKSFQFTSNGGFSGAGPIAGPVIRYEIRIAPGENANGADDNGNGLIDEGSLVRVDTSTAEEIILTNTLSTAGCTFTANSGGLDIRLTTSGYTLGATVATEAERLITVHPRN